MQCVNVIQCVHLLHLWFSPKIEPQTSQICFSCGNYINGNEAVRINVSFNFRRERNRCSELRVTHSGRRSKTNHRLFGDGKPHHARQRSCVGRASIKIHTSNERCAIVQHTPLIQLRFFSWIARGAWSSMIAAHTVSLVSFVPVTCLRWHNFRIGVYVLYSAPALQLLVNGNDP